MTLRDFRPPLVLPLQGLTHNEVRLLAENVHDQPEHHDDRAKRAEFSLPTWLVLNALEVMGFKVPV